MPHGQFWMCLWDVQILTMRLSSCSEPKMSIILSKKVLKYLSKNISDFKKNKSSQFLDVCWYGEGFCHIVQNLRYMAQETCKNCGDFFFEIWNIFWQIFQNFFRENYGHFELTTRWWSHNKYLHISKAHSKLSMGHFLGTFRQFFQKFWMKPSNFVFERFNELNWF